MTSTVDTPVAMPALPARLPLNPLRLIRAAHAARTLRLELETKSDHLLNDIGILRGDIPSLVRAYRRQLLA